MVRFAVTRGERFSGLAITLLAGAVAGAITLAAGRVQAGPAAEAWSDADKAALAAMAIHLLPAAPPDPSNKVADKPEAVALGRQLFFDKRLSLNGQVACASCHAPERGFQDGLALARGLDVGTRRTMPIAGAAHSPWLFWDGRKDSLWSQALGPLEDPAEHGADRVQLVRVLDAHYRPAYERLFGDLPEIAKLPAHATPLGTEEQRQAWAGLSATQQDAVNQAFANLGKSIAAYERSVVPGESRFDRYVQAVLAGDPAGGRALTPLEVRGLRVFIGKGQCASCHSGPLLTDQHFHNTGVRPRDPLKPDRGRGPALARVQLDAFNCLGRYSDAPALSCEELRFIATDDAAMEGAFKTPGLRDVAARAPYMHAGQLATLEEVVAHYRLSPKAAVGQSELSHAGQAHPGRTPIRLTDEEADALVAMLKTLNSLSMGSLGALQR